MKTGYERVNKGEKFYYIDFEGCVDEDYDGGTMADEKGYNTANYYSSSLVAEENARADELLRKLRRFAVEHNECELDWKNLGKHKYYICFDYEEQKIIIDDIRYHRDYAQIYFSSEKIAKQAIEEYKGELLWYFTEYQDHVTEPKKIECEYCGNAEKLQAMKVLGFKCCYECGKELSE